MSEPRLSKPQPSAISQPIPSLTVSSSVSSSFLPTPKSSVSRKKPLGLQIDKSIPKHTRATPLVPSDEISPWATEADRLRQDIERLQLSSQSNSSILSLTSSLSSSPTAPTTPILLSVQSDSSSGSAREKPTASRVGVKGSKRNRKDKDGEDLVKDEDLELIADLGAGNGGTVTKVWNKKRGCAMARKLILVDAKPSVRKQILRELQIMNDCSSPFIVGYYGCFPVDVHVGIAMEYMDAGRNGSVPIDIVGKVAEAVLKGLIPKTVGPRLSMALFCELDRLPAFALVSRPVDIKPSNILANSVGEIKICDFGVSGELINSIANTFVGTSTYMSPERIQGAAYTIKSDVWSLGISLIELALGRFPFSDSPEKMDFDPDATLPQRPAANNGVSLGGGGHTMSILDLLQHIVNEPAPQLSSRFREFPREAVEFVEGCLNKDPQARKSPQDLLVN
ncbi:MAG: MAP kinase kinase (MEK) [Tremellales sp. Tagirdzhanova-0007]|nr:MAG: MAP kinase kinase (MEK) [Tremellales sp. Tagirdzhanova-0007]